MSFEREGLSACCSSDVYRDCMSIVLFIFAFRNVELYAVSGFFHVSFVLLDFGEISSYLLSVT